MPADKLLDLRSQFKLGNNFEATLELDPGTFNQAKLEHLSAENGFNRISMGIQTLNEKEFEALGRGHEYG